MVVIDQEDEVQGDVEQVVVGEINLNLIFIILIIYKHVYFGAVYFRLTTTFSFFFLLPVCMRY